MNRREISLKQQELNERFREFVCSFLPIRQFSVSVDDDLTEHCVSASIVNSDHPDKVIEVSTYGCEVTFYFSDYHVHFDWLSNFDQEGEFLEFQDFLEKFLKDQILIVECYEGDRYTSGSWVEDLAGLPKFDASRTEIRSWSGRLDSTLFR